MKILVKFPTRQRPKTFLEVLAQYVDSSADKANIHYLITIDHDDPTMSQAVCNKAIEICGKENITIVSGTSLNKIHACNRDLNEFDGLWDIVVLASDDMRPRAKDWDNIIRDEMRTHFPDTDGCLWFYDGHQNRICTMSMLGRAYYDRFKYIYHPDYVSLWCDNEFTEVALAANKMIKYDVCLFFHNHHIWTRQADLNDALYKRNDVYFVQDRHTYTRRKANNFK